MNITIKKGMDVTEPLETYIEEKLAPLAKFIKYYEEKGDLELRVEVSRTTNHHKKGEDIFMATAHMNLPHRLLRSEASASDIRVAVDEVREMLHMEIEKYKATHDDHHRGEKTR